MHVEVSRLGVHYPRRPRPAVDDVSFGLAAGDIGVLIGPSGCGKTTLLRAIAGLERVSAGEVRISGVVVGSAAVDVPAEARRIGMVFQDYALFPHLDVGHNVGFGIAHVLAHLGGPIEDWWKDLGSPLMTAELKQQVAEGVAAALGERHERELERTRDALLLNLIRAKSASGTLET